MIGPDLDVTVVLPCLDEAATVGRCVAMASEAMRREGLGGEVVVADNGSRDDSRAVAAAAGARVVLVDVRGYGAALRAGIDAARGDVVVMADADLSYDLSDVPRFVRAVREGSDLVMGDRFAGGIERGAMPLMNRLVGNPVLSWLGRRLTGTDVRDFHCGMRAFRREAIVRLDLRTSGMEFASEMVARAALHGLRIGQIATPLRVDGRGRASHLRPISDGSRHVATLLFLARRSPSPRPLRVVALALGVLALWLSVGDLTVGELRLSIGSLLVTVTGLTVAVIGAMLTETIGLGSRARIADTPRQGDGAVRRHWSSARRALARWIPWTGIAAGSALVMAQVLGWAASGFGDRVAADLVRSLALPCIAVIVGTLELLHRLVLSALSTNWRAGSAT